jgi:L-histidine N-alpha-methyltransferase
MSRPHEAGAVDHLPGAARDAFAADVQYYLMQNPRQLPSRYLYDELGSALFEAICRLPWYSITRAEMRLLEREGAEIFRRIAPVSALVELGPGSGEKLSTLIRARSCGGPLALHVVDLSRRALETSTRTVGHLDDVSVTAHEASYEEGLRDAVRLRPPAGRTLVLFLGSNIGNFDPPGAHAFLHGIRSALRSGDALLLGADLVKPAPRLELAYADPLGVTAAFNRNLLVRINRELGGDFVVDQFAHRALLNEYHSRVEMHLISRRTQAIRVDGAGLAFTMPKGDAIWTESSYKYQADQVGAMIEAAGFRVDAQWVDRVDAFALTLAAAL